MHFQLHLALQWMQVEHREKGQCEYRTVNKTSASARSIHIYNHVSTSIRLSRAIGYPPKCTQEHRPISSSSCSFKFLFFLHRFLFSTSFYSLAAYTICQQPCIDINMQLCYIRAASNIVFTVILIIIEFLNTLQYFASNILITIQLAFFSEGVSNKPE